MAEDMDAGARAGRATVGGLDRALVRRQTYAPPASDPILGVGHGAMALPNGTFAQPTPQFARDAQAYYKTLLFDQASDPVKAEYQTVRLQLEPVEGDPREFVDNALLIDWLVEHVGPADAARLRSINNYLAREMTNDELPVELAIKQGNNESRLAYKARCEENRVPIPPRWNPDATDRTNLWKPVGPLDPDFIGVRSNGTVWYYEPTDPSEPRGVCIALPRVEGGVIKLLGVICQGNESSKACFWDNAEPMALDESADIISDSFNGGPDLEGACGGVCTQCHRGENVFIVHPGSNLDLGRSLLLADDWVDPLVPLSWHQNPKPADKPAPDDKLRLENYTRPAGEGSCLDCHSPLGSAGRLGLLTEGYCNIVLTAITEPEPPEEGDTTAQPAKTMPPNNAEYHKLTPSDEMAIRTICAGQEQVVEPRNDPPPTEPTEPESTPETEPEEEEPQP